MCVFTVKWGEGGAQRTEAGTSQGFPEKKDQWETYYEELAYRFWRPRGPMIAYCKLDTQESWWYNLVGVCRPENKESG